MKKGIFFSVIGLLLIFGVLAGVKALQIRDLIQAGESMQQPPTAVASELVVEDDWRSSLVSVGALEASQGVILTADLPGRISKITFEAGARVEAGELLVEQEVSSELTQLEAAEADKNLAQANLTRVSRLFRQKLVSRSEYDSAQATFKSAAARADTVLASLDKKQIIAPFTGRLGLSQVDVGQNISAGTPIVSLQATDKMLINFALPQQQVAKLRSGLTVNVATDALPDEQFVGLISAIDSEISATTRTVNVQASLDNPDGKLLPGMFARVEVVLPVTRPVVYVPLTAISYASFGDSVFVIEPPQSEGESQPAQTGQAGSGGLVARQQFVQLGERRGDFVEIVKGVSAGERVASAGVFKLRNGAPVTLNETVKPEYNLQPNVPDR